MVTRLSLLRLAPDFWPCAGADAGGRGLADAGGRGLAPSPGRECFSARSAKSNIRE